MYKGEFKSDKKEKLCMHVNQLESSSNGVLDYKRKL